MDLRSNNRHPSDADCTHITDGRTCTRPSGVLLRIGALLLSMALIWIFIFVIAPWIQKLPYVKPLADYIEENDIDAGALYYTEVEEFSEAERNMRDTMDYPPREQKNK